MDTNQVCVFKMPRMSGKSTFVKLYILNRCASENDLNILFVSLTNSDNFFTRGVISNFNIHDLIDWDKTKMGKKYPTIYFKNTNSSITLSNRIEYRISLDYENYSIVALDDCEYILGNSTNVDNCMIYVRGMYNRKTQLICTLSHNTLDGIKDILKKQPIKYHFDEKSESDLNNFNKFLRVLKIKNFCDD